MQLRLAALDLLLAGTRPLPAQPALTPVQRPLNIDSFEMVWQTVRDKHWDPKLGGLDWQAIHDGLRPKVEKAATLDEGRAGMPDRLRRLKQTHFGIVPGEAYQEMGSSAADDDSGPRDASPGIDARVIDSRVLVTSVEPDSPAAAAGVKPGWEILRIDGKDLAPGLAKIRDSLSSQPTLIDLLQAHAVTSRLSGNAGKPVEVQFFDGRGKKVSMTVT